MLELSAVASLDQSAFVFARGGELSYAEFASLSARRMRSLEQQGLERGSYRPLVARTDLDFLVELAAHLELRQPVLLLDPRAPEDDRARLCARVASHRAAQEDRIVLATSGSTGRPKLVVHTEASLLGAARSSEHNLGWLPSGDRWYLSLPLCHVGGLALVLRCLLARQTIVVGGARSSQSADVHSELVAHDVTLLSLVPTQLARLLPFLEAHPARRLRAVLVGGAPLFPDLRTSALAAGLPLLTTYGLTEMSSQVATERLAELSRGARVDRPTGFVGPPLPGVDLRLTHDGRIAVRGPMAMRGYLDEEEPPQTEAGHARAESAFDREGYFLTSDLGTLDPEGNLCVLGRVDNVLLSGGENVPAEWVEAALSSLPEVQGVCVVGRPDPDWGMRIVAAVSLQPAASASSTSPAALLDAVRALLPAFAVPKELHIWPELPLLPLGKVDRRAVARALGA